LVFRGWQLVLGWRPIVLGWWRWMVLRGILLWWKLGRQQQRKRLRVWTLRMVIRKA
jgi:hypothetical protein